MKSKLIIHIGLHKTATTYIQREFFPMLDNVMYIQGNNFFREWYKKYKFESKYVLLSSEGFSGFAWNELWKKGINNEHTWINSFKLNIKLIKKVFPNAVIIVFFRKHGDLLISMFKQYIQEGGTLNFENFYGEGKVIQSSDLSFRDRIDPLCDSFEEVYFLNYEEFKSYGDKYIENFFIEEFGIEKNRKRNNDIIINRSISDYNIEILRRINPIYNKIPLKIRKVIRFMRLSPRDILQRSKINLSNKESYVHNIDEIRKKINEQHIEDWEYFRERQWSYRKH